MQGFSISSVTSICKTISGRALSTATEIDEVLRSTSGTAASPEVKKLAFLAIKLQQFRQHTDLLETCLSTCTVLSPTLQGLVLSTLPDCDVASSIMNKQVMRLGPNLNPELVSSDATSQYEWFVVCYSRVFLFVMQLLTS
jgi:hypothetical protein